MIEIDFEVDFEVVEWNEDGVFVVFFYVDFVFDVDEFFGSFLFL